jgi:uncharacterized protein GlcG (DUF336 family)
MASRWTTAACIVAGIAMVASACDRRDRRTGIGTPTTQPGIAQEVRTAEERADAAAAGEGCNSVPSADDLRRWLREAPGQGEAGGLGGGRKEWAAVVDRQGVLCAVVVSTDDPAEAWPGSQQVAKAKAYTANAFSTDDVPLSTARLYTLTQPGHSLWGLAAGNPLRPECVVAPADHDRRDRRVCGGTIAFGGGVPLYRDGKRVGGLGASGDTACADHEIAKRIRQAAGLDPAGGALADDITFSGVDGASAFTHPLCANTWRNNARIGDEAAAVGY